MADRLQSCLDRFWKIDSLKLEQKQALEELLSGKDVLAILPMRFGKSLIYQVYCHARTSTESVLVISLLNGIVEEQVNEMNELRIPAIHLNPNSQECLFDGSFGHTKLIFKLYC